MKDTMKAVVKHGYGKGETIYTDVPIPEIGPGDVLLQVKAAGLCGTDLALDNGEEPWLLRPPVVLGHEFAGVVAAVGEDVRAFRPGMRIVSENTGYVCGHCAACNRGNYLLCEKRLGLGYGMDGGFTSYVKIPGEILQKYPDCLYEIPANMSFDEAAIMDPCSNAYRAVVQDACIQPGEDVVIFGLGALGLFALQWARLSGANRIICVGMASDRERFATAQKLGADYCIAADLEDTCQAVEAISREVYVAIDCAGKNAVLRTCLDLVKPGGRIIMVGMDAQPVGFSLEYTVRKGLSIRGHQGYDWDCWHKSLKMYESGKLDFKSLLTQRMPISRFREAFDLARAQKAVKIILVPEGEAV